MRRAVVISGGSMQNYELMRQYVNDDDYIICADSGIIHCEKMNLKADLLVGDFDSCSEKRAVESAAAKNAVIEKLNCEKDDTDTEHAVMRAVYMGFDTVILLGVLGNRADHTLSNVFLLEKLFSCGIDARIINENNEIFFLKNSRAVLKKDNRKYVSVVSVGERSEGVSLKGFKYPLSNAVLKRDSTLSVSNELTEYEGEVCVKNGSVLVIRASDL